MTARRIAINRSPQRCSANLLTTCGSSTPPAMPQRKREAPQLHKRSDFFPPVSCGPQQNDQITRSTADFLVNASASSSLANTVAAADANCSGTSTSTFSSPAKSKPCRDPSPSCKDVMQEEVSADYAAPTPRPSQDPIAEFPTSGQPVSDTVLKDMLLSLRASLQADLMNCIAQHKLEI